MKKDERFSEEQLNALVDGELDPEEKSRLYNESARSPELDQRLCQQRKVKELVRHAYDEVPQATRPGSPPLVQSGFLGKALVASTLLALGLTAGFVGHNLIDERQATAGITSSQFLAEPENYLIHVVSGDPVQMQAALEHAQFLLDTAADGEVRQVEIVANERGLDLLRRDVTPFATEIATLQENNVVFYACSRTIERLEESGVEVVLLPDTRQEYTALDRVVTRMKDGWKYEKI